MPNRVRFALLLPALVLAACRRPDAVPEQEVARPVVAERLQPASLTPSITLLGVVAAGSRIPLVTPVAGTLRHAGGGAPASGRRVRAGEAVALLEDESTRHAVIEAELELSRQRTETERMRQAHAQGVVDERSRQEAEADLLLAEERLKSRRLQSQALTLTASRDGTLSVTAPIADGTFVAGGVTIAEVVTEGALRVDAAAAAADRAALAPGLPVRLSCTGHPDGQGRVAEVAPVVDAAGTVRVVVAVHEWNEPPVPGEGVTAEVALPERLDALTLPMTAVVVGSHGAAAFVVERTGAYEGSPTRVRRRAVTLGRRGADRIEIVSGLTDGELVVTAGADVLSDGDPVTVEQPAAP